MSNFIIATSSPSDLPADYTEKHHIPVLKYTYTIDGIDHMDGDMEPKAFYDIVRAGATPTTSQLTPDRIIQCFDKVLSEGNDLLYISFSSGLSGSCNNVRLVVADLKEKYPDRKIYVVDSLCASLGLGLLIDYAVKMRDSGASISETAKWVEANKLNINHWFTVDSLSHLRRGGRVTGAAAFVGTLLQIKPVLNVDYEGHLIPREKEKGRKRAIRSLVEKMEEFIHNPDGQTVFISHADDLAAAQRLEAMIKEKFPGIGPIMIGSIGCVIGAHSGPGTIALFFMGKSR